MKDNKFFMSDEKKYLSNDKELCRVLVKICDFAEKYENPGYVTRHVLRNNYWFVQQGMSNQKHCDE